jgi:hypothetical protein
MRYLCLNQFLQAKVDGNFDKNRPLFIQTPDFLVSENKIFQERRLFSLIKKLSHFIRP